MLEVPPWHYPATASVRTPDGPGAAQYSYGEKWLGHCAPSQLPLGGPKPDSIAFAQPGIATHQARAPRARVAAVRPVEGAAHAQLRHADHAAVRHARAHSSSDLL